MIFTFGDKKLDIVHEEIQKDWPAVDIEMGEAIEAVIIEYENELRKHNLTLNDFFIAILKDAVEGAGKDDKNT